MYNCPLLPSLPQSLTLCHSIHQIHFQLLLLVSSYIKLLNLLSTGIINMSVINISQQMTDIKSQIQTALQQDIGSGGLTAVIDRETELSIHNMKPEQAMRYLQDSVVKHHSYWSIQLLHVTR